MIGPRDKDLRAIYDHMFAADDRDMFSKKSDVRARLEIASRFSRGNVRLQNSAIVDRDFDRKISSEVSRLLSAFKKPTK